MRGKKTPESTKEQFDILFKKQEQILDSLQQIHQSLLELSIAIINSKGG